MPHILIVEDDIAFGTMLQTWLRKKGFEVDKATSVGAAVKLLVDTSVDLVLSDLRLPDHDGLRLLKWMREHNNNAPFIVMTNYAEVQNAVLAMKSGAADYIAKPVQPDILLQKIKCCRCKHLQQQPLQPNQHVKRLPRLIKRRLRHVISKARARLRANYIAMWSWLPLPQCRCSYLVLRARARSMWHAAYTSLALATTVHSLPSTVVPYHVM